MEKKRKRGRPRKPKRPPKKSGVPPKHKKFYEIRLGYYLQHEAPLEYNIIMDVSGKQDPNPDLVEAIGYASLNHLFRTAKFRKALIDYREHGCYGEVKRKNEQHEINYAIKKKALKFM